ncbi:MAG: hypothetical protein Q9225_002469 [Loekoesia sp. 1 TL-2023]
MASIPWDESPEFLATSDWTIAPGGHTHYDPPRRVGKGGPQDVTSFHPGYVSSSPEPPIKLTLLRQANWSEQHMPDILYVFKPPQGWINFKQSHTKRRHLPPPKKDDDGKTIYEQWPKDPVNPEPLLDFKHLPDRIGTRDYWWVYEAWRRYDPRIRWKDIFMRQDGTVRSSGPNGSTIQPLVGRNRTIHKMISWHDQEDSLGGNNRPKWIDEMTNQQKLDNTTRGLTPGLVNPTLGEAGERIPFPNRIKGAGEHKKMVLGGRRKRQPKKPKGDNFEAREEHGGQCIGQPVPGSPSPGSSPLLSDTPIAPLPPSKRRKIPIDNDIGSHQGSDFGTFRQAWPRQFLAQNRQTTQSISPYEFSTGPTPTALHPAVPYTNTVQSYGHLNRIDTTVPQALNRAESSYPRHGHRGVDRHVPILTRQDAFYVPNESYQPRLVAPQNVQNRMTNPESITDWLDNVYDFGTAAPPDAAAVMHDPSRHPFDQHFPSGSGSISGPHGGHRPLSVPSRTPDFGNDEATPDHQLNVPEIPESVAPPAPMHPALPYNAPTVPSTRTRAA